MTVQALIHLLKLLPPEATVHVVDGSDRGIIIRADEDERPELAFFSTEPM